MNEHFSLQQLMRWYGPDDPVPLDHIAQAGCTGVVSALHTIPVGEVWPLEAIEAHRKMIAGRNLSWTVVESLPVHESIKIGAADADHYIRQYQESLRNLARCGIEVVTYNFMPVLDWVRTDVNRRLPNGAETLFFNKLDYGVFDLFLLGRPDAAADYDALVREQLAEHLQSMDKAKKKRLLQTVFLGLPGSEVPFTADQVLALLRQYRQVDRQRLKGNLIRFLKQVAPVAEELGIKLAIHPDDPPFSVLGLPRIMSTDQDVADIVKAVPEPANGLCFCTGSFGARPDNDLPAMIRKWGSRIHFFHLRNVKRDEDGNFIEADHLDGDVDMFGLMLEIVRLMQSERRSIPMRPDHGYKMLDDLAKKTYPGYSAIGRLKGLAELRGLEYAVSRFLRGSE